MTEKCIKYFRGKLKDEGIVIINIHERNIGELNYIKPYILMNMENQISTDPVIVEDLTIPLS